MSLSYTERAVKIGDQMQSAVSRLAEFIREYDVAYEVEMAALEAAAAVKDWTELRRKWSGS